MLLWFFFHCYNLFFYYQLIECLHWNTYFVYKYDNITWRTIHTGVSVFCIFLSTRQNITKKRFGTKQLFPLLKYMIKQIIHNMSFFISYPLSALIHISSLEPILLSGWYHDLRLIKGMIWKMQCNNLCI